MVITKDSCWQTAPLPPTRPPCHQPDRQDPYLQHGHRAISQTGKTLTSLTSNTATVPPARPARPLPPTRPPCHQPDRQDPYLQHGHRATSQTGKTLTSNTATVPSARPARPLPPTRPPCHQPDRQRRGWRCRLGTDTVTALRHAAVVPTPVSCTHTQPQ